MIIEYRGVQKMQNGYDDYFNIWLKGLRSEISFWKKFMEEQGGESFYGWERMVSPTRMFELEEDIPPSKYGGEYMFADIGSGPFSRCGIITSKVKLNSVWVDPLASVYEELKRNNHLEDKINLETGFVELLDRKFSKNTFDMVHMSNSLDHCFDAVHGITQLLNICKIGGKVILRHHEDEAERGNYTGLHQWNISLNNPEHSFVIWRKEVRYDICRILSDYADIELFPNQVEETGWIYNKVILTKKKDIELPATDYYERMFDCTYKYLLQILLDEEEKAEVKQSYTDSLYRKIRQIYFSPQYFCERLKEDGIDEVVIYGMGEIGKRVIHLFKKCKINILTVIDKRKLTYMGISSVNPESFNLKGTKLIVIAVKDGVEEIKSELKTRLKGEDGCFLHIEELIQKYSDIV